MPGNEFPKVLGYNPSTPSCSWKPISGDSLLGISIGRGFWGSKGVIITRLGFQRENVTKEIDENIIGQTKQSFLTGRRCVHWCVH